MNKRWGIRVLILAAILIMSLGARFANLYTDYKWFNIVGYETIFSTILITKLFLFVIGALVAYIIFWINTRIAQTIGKPKLPNAIAKIATIVLSLIMGSIVMANWDTLLQYLNQVPFGITDPIFNLDISFYIFSLPVFELAVRLGTFLIGFSLALAGLTYMSESLSKLQPKMNVDQYGNKMPDFSSMKSAKALSSKAKAHLGILGGLLFLLIGINHYLDRYSILYSTRGVIFGAGFTDTTVSLPALSLLFFISIAVGLVIVAWMFILGRRPKLSKKHLVVFAIGIYIIVLVLGTQIIPAIIQYIKVSPNELDIEKPYIENTIKYTRLGYGLDNVAEMEYPAAQNITREDILNNPETIENIRLLDWRPLMKTYKQLQEIRLYYDFLDVDVDRYHLDDGYRQVMLSAREMNTKQLTPQAQTWLNMHMVYTHGYGVAMSPVNRVTKEGQPDFIVQDIPPMTEESSLQIDRPEIYYGEHQNEFVIVGATQEEFDFPKGDQNAYTNYAGKGGVPIKDIWTRLLMAIRFGDAKVLISSAITKDSKLMLYRNVQDRIHKIAPFLSLDPDPYLVVAGGKLYWIQDAYTVSNKFPYSEPTMGLNYIRNSVKIVVDAYDGNVNFYVVDKKDPIINTWQRVFPKQFKNIDEMPMELKSHLRYPEGLFRIQADKYAVYHMEDTGVFYNKEDAWDLPNEIYGQGQQTPMTPYYVIIKPEGWEKEEFTLMVPFTPRKKDNMIAWMAAKSDDTYGELVLYKLPKDKLVYGPMQIEARIDQDAEISQQLTLWSQKGSSVTRGNVLVIPIESSMLYVEPLYIQAERSQMPELKRVIVSDGTKVVMEETFDNALNALLGEQPIKTDVGENDKNDESKNTIVKAWEIYKEAIGDVKEGNWDAFGSGMNKLGEVLEELATS